ncbi:cysteine hydrolase [Hymenobacter tibetensis]|uniref:Cysteine hydrolase n=1 Tax=Hymenobacter tibetensis TaxID=497967 RepID=A0ABY4CZC5_9BACT|nr:cysteine hydrolase [Hymenobacter tibetensis]UOG75421.1 cysteine hydrolase [Hymenobacter tibetensis]
MQHAFGLDIPRTLEEVCHPQRMALIVYDMQVGILHQLKDGPAITKQVLRVVEAARRANIRVIFMRHMSVPKELMGVAQLRMAMAWQRTESVADIKPWFLPSNPAFQLTPELQPLPSEAVFDKITMSAFEGTPLNIVLRDCGINAFAIVGVATEIGIDPTVRHASDLGYIPVIVTDACGAGHAEAGRQSIANLEYAGDSMLTDVASICQVFEAIATEHNATAAPGR